MQLQRIVSRYARDLGHEDAVSLVGGLNRHLEDRGAAPVSVENFLGLLMGLEPASPVMLVALADHLCLTPEESEELWASWIAVGSEGPRKN